MTASLDPIGIRTAVSSGAAFLFAVGEACCNDCARDYEDRLGSDFDWAVVDVLTTEEAARLACVICQQPIVRVLS